MTVAVLLFTEKAFRVADGWSTAHATFYGGSDASGTNSKFLNPSLTLELGIADFIALVWEVWVHL